MSLEVFRFEKLNREGFEALAADYAHVVIPLEQTPYWADFERSLGRGVHGIWAYFDGDKLIAVASFLRLTRRFRESLVSVNGPTWFIERTPNAELRLMQTVQKQFGEDPEIAPLYIRMQVAHLQEPATGPIEHGWYEREIVVDLTPDERDILKAFRPNARNSIRKAGRSGVEVRTIDRADWVDIFRRELFPILEETSARDGFSSFESAYYEQLLTVLGDYLRLMVAYDNGTAVSWLITTEYRGYAVYYFAASSHQARKSSAQYLLLWEAFRVLKAAGNHSCGLTGIISKNYPQLANVTTFKRNFSKNVVEIPTTYDIPLNVRRYRAVAAVLHARRTLPGKARGLMASVKLRAAGLPRRSKVDA